ncbi:hypothetical protein TNCV_1944011 [Trichonephila clavipes]|nr:hypothetical protein TNCV_1944011 [Trichonephila clavipes]
MRLNTYSAHLSTHVTLGTEMYEQMSRSHGQSEVKSAVFNPQVSLVLIYQPTEGIAQAQQKNSLDIGSKAPKFLFLEKESKENTIQTGFQVFFPCKRSICAANPAFIKINCNAIKSDERRGILSLSFWISS